MICAIFKYNIVDIIDHDPIVATMLYIQTSKHDQEIPESQTIDQPLVPRQNECVLIVFVVYNPKRNARVQKDLSEGSNYDSVFFFFFFFS